MQQEAASAMNAIFGGRFVERVRRYSPGTTPVGFWRSRQEPGLPDPHDLVDVDWDAREREAVIAHLEAGAVVMRWLGPSNCRFCGQQNGNADLTDGTYLWPSGLAHYLRDHGVRLPPPVVDRMLGRGQQG
jgi:hypothetical protein